MIILENKKFNLNDKNKQPLYRLLGTVVHGRGIGRLVCMPTANMHTEFIGKFPPIGVYTTVIFWNCAKYYGVTNVGKRPTIDNDDYISIETYFLDFNNDIYGQEIEIQLYELLRLPLKFESLSQLREQVFIDGQITRRYFGILIQEEIVNEERAFNDISDSANYRFVRKRICCQQ